MFFLRLSVFLDFPMVAGSGHQDPEQNSTKGCVLCFPCAPAHLRCIKDILRFSIAILAQDSYQARPRCTRKLSLRKMAARLFARVLVSVVVLAAADVCPGEGDLLSVVTSIAPECFGRCLQLCGPLEGLITSYMASSDVNAVKAQVCAQKQAFSCLFEGGMATCAPVMAAGTSFGLDLPTDMADLQSQCAAFKGQGEGVPEDVNQNEGEGIKDDEHKAQDIQATSAAPVVTSGASAAAGPLIALVSISVSLQL